jgi:hypothetical protein
MIFAREVTGPLTSLVKKIDAETGKQKDASMGSFVVFCSDAEGLEVQLQKLAEKEKLKDIILAIDNPTGPPKYKIAKDADVTVVLYLEHEVKANFALKKGELNDKKIEEIIKALPKILPSK